jgi:hypothetical protein
VAYTYAAFYEGEQHFRRGDLAAARPPLRRFVAGPAAPRQKAYALAMLLDSHLHTRLTPRLIALYRRLRGVRAGDGYDPA